MESEGLWEVPKVPLLMLQPRSNLALDAVCVYFFCWRRQQIVRELIGTLNVSSICFFNNVASVFCIGHYRCTDLLLSDYKVLS